MQRFYVYVHGWGVGMSPLATNNLYYIYFTRKHILGSQPSAQVRGAPGCPRGSLLPQHDAA